MSEQRIAVDQLSVGMFIRLDLKWYEHPFFFNSFKIKSADQIQTIKDLGLAHVVYSPEKSDPSREQDQIEAQPHLGEIELPSKQDESSDTVLNLRRELIRQHKERNRRIQRCEQRYGRTYNQVKNVMRNLLTGSQEVTEEAALVIKDLVSSLLDDREVVLHLINAKGDDEGAFYHTLNVAILGLMLGKEEGLDGETLQQLGMGALFHDIGKSRIPKKILYKQGPLTPSERQLLRHHPQYGEEIASRIEDFPQEALQIIRQHHEAINGKGYPDRLTKDQISLAARITSIVNLYDNYCNNPNQEDALTPHETLSHMYCRLKDRVDNHLLQKFIRSMGVYPPGTIVQLSNKLIGIVIAVNLKNQLRPALLMYDADIPPREALILDLNDDPELSIVRSFRPSQLPAEVYSYLNPHARVSYFFDSSRLASDSIKP